MKTWDAEVLHALQLSQHEFAQQRFWNRVEHKALRWGGQIYYVSNRQTALPDRVALPLAGDGLWPKSVPSFACCSPNKFVFCQLSAGVPLCSCFYLPPCTWDALQDLELWELLLSVWSATVIFSLSRQTLQCTTLNTFGGFFLFLFMTCLFNTLILGRTLCRRWAAMIYIFKSPFHLYLMFDATQFTVNWQMSLRQHPKITC